MGAKLFIRSLQRIASYPGDRKLQAFVRHFTWQFARHRKDFPFEIPITPASKLIIGSPEAIGGGAALTWSLGLYDYDNMSFLKDILKRSPSEKVFFDIGANFGIYSLLASENSQTRAFAFEPHPVTASLLSANVDGNHRDNVRVFKCAVSNQAGTLHFTDRPGSSLNHLVEEDSDSQNTISVPTVRAESICNEYSVAPHIVKIDVEGHEAEVLEGFGDKLQKAEIVFIERNLPSDLLQTYFPAGDFDYYYVHFGTKSLSKDPSCRHQDVVFIKSTYLPELRSLGYEVRD